MAYLVETPGKTGLLADRCGPTASGSSRRTRSRSRSRWPRPPRRRHDRPAASRCSAFVCSEASSVCMIKSFVWNVPVILGRKSGRTDRPDGRSPSARVTETRSDPTATVAPRGPTSAVIARRRTSRRIGAQADRQGVAQGLAFLGGLAARGTRAPAAGSISSAPSSASRARTRDTQSSSRSRARSPETRASCERAKIASAVSRPGGTGDRAGRSCQRSAASLRTTVFAGP